MGPDKKPSYSASRLELNFYRIIYICLTVNLYCFTMQSFALTPVCQNCKELLPSYILIKLIIVYTKGVVHTFGVSIRFIV